MRLRLSLRGQVQEFDAELRQGELLLQFAAGPARRYTVLADAPDHIALADGTRTVRAFIAGQRHELHIHSAGRTLHVHRVDAAEAESQSGQGADPVLRAPMPGRVLEILTELGATVEVGTPLLLVEAMKMQVDLLAPVAGRVVSIHVRRGELVEPEATLITLEPEATLITPEPHAP